MIPTKSLVSRPQDLQLRRRSGITLIALSLALLLSLSVAPAAQAWDAPIPPAEYERQMLPLINADRVAHGMQPLTMTIQMSNVARAWSSTMADGGTAQDAWAAFDHNPNYANQIPSGWWSAAENIAVGTEGWFTFQDMHDGLMGSPGHYANLMNPSFTHIGLGIVHRNGFTWGTQVFGNYPNPVQAGTPSNAPTTPQKHESSAAVRQIVPSSDLNGDGYGDVLSVDANGALWIHAAYYNGFTSAGTRVSSSGWKSLTVYAPGDINRDGKADILAKDAKGELYFYPGKGNGTFGSSTRVGWGWGDLEIIPAGDITGDGIPDVLAINPAGELFYYAGNGAGGFKGKLTRNGQGWGGFDLYPAGDINGDGRADILSIDSSGKLFTHLGKGGGAFRKSYESGVGWVGFDLFAGADVNLDGYADLYSRDRSGKLYFYAGRSGGGFRTKVQVGTNWN